MRITEVNLRTGPFVKDDIFAALRLLTRENELVLRTMFATGLRVGDVLAFRTEDVRKTSFTIKEEKTGKKRRVRLGSQLRQDLLGISGRVFVFEHRNEQFKHRTRQAVWKDLKRAAKLLRLPDTISTHSARKTWAVEKFKKGYTVDEIQKIMNHSTPEITMVYCLADKITAKKCNSKNRKKT